MGFLTKADIDYGLAQARGRDVDEEMDGKALEFLYEYFDEGTVDGVAIGAYAAELRRKRERSEIRCGTCDHWDRETTQCRVRAPVVIDPPRYAVFTVCPSTAEDFWCAEHSAWRTT